MGLLIVGAIREAYSSKAEVAFQTWLRGGGVARVGAAAVGGAVSAYLATLTVTAAVAGGVALSAATFGIGPAVAIVVTLALLKTGKAAKYSGQSKTVKAALMESHVTSKIADDLVEVHVFEAAMAKVIRKYERVVERFNQIDKRRNRAARALSKIWNPRTATKTFGSEAGRQKLSPTVTYDDEALNALLRQLRYYGQSLYSSVDLVLEKFMREKHDLVAEKCTSVHRRVYEYSASMSEDHSRCWESRCLATSDERRTELTECLELSEGLTQDEIGVEDLRELPFRELRSIQFTSLATHRLRMRELQQTGRERARGMIVNDVLDRGQKAAIVGSPDVMATVKTFALSAPAPMVADLSAAHAVNAAATAAATYTGAMTSAAGAVVAGEVMSTVKNRLTRAAVLKDKRMGAARILVSQQLESQSGALAEFAEVLGSHNIINRGPRVANKVVWYLEKLKKIEDRFVAVCTDLSDDRGRDRKLETCDEAWRLVQEGHYYFHNCEKFLSFLVYLQTILLQIDRAVSELPIGVTTGEMIRPGADVVPIDGNVDRAKVWLHDLRSERAAHEERGRALPKIAAAQTAAVRRKAVADVGTLVPVEADGNCFFRAVAVAMGEPQSRHLHYRALAVGRLRTFDRRELGITDEYLAEMAQPATNPSQVHRYGGFLEAYALSKDLRREIVIYSAAFPRPQIAWDPRETVVNDPPIRIFWYAHGHYEAFAPGPAADGARGDAAPVVASPGKRNGTGRDRKVDLANGRPVRFAHAPPRCAPLMESAHVPWPIPSFAR